MSLGAVQQITPEMVQQNNSEMTALQNSIWKNDSLKSDSFGKAIGVGLVVVTAMLIIGVVLRYLGSPADVYGFNAFSPTAKAGFIIVCASPAGLAIGGVVYKMLTKNALTEQEVTSKQKQLEPLRLISLCRDEAIRAKVNETLKDKPNVNLPLLCKSCGEYVRIARLRDLTNKTLEKHNQRLQELEKEIAGVGNAPSEL